MKGHNGMKCTRTRPERGIRPRCGRCTRRTLLSTVGQRCWPPDPTRRLGEGKQVVLQIFRFPDFVTESIRGVGDARTGHELLHQEPQGGRAGPPRVRRRWCAGGDRRTRRRAKTPPKRRSGCLLKRGARALGRGRGLSAQAGGDRANPHPGAPPRGRLPQTQWTVEATT
jgi:hypothetical protein